jgi:hypothetical protein
MGDRRGAHMVLVGRPDGKRTLGVYRIILKWIFKKCGMGRHGLDCSRSGEGQVSGACGCGSEPSGSIKCGEFLG